MKLIPQKVIHMTLFLVVFTILFSCSEDTDLLLASVVNEPEVSLVEKDPLAEDHAEEDLETRIFAFSPTNDAYVEDEQGYDQTIIRLQEDHRTSYLMFDLSQVNGTITDAVLQFSIDSDEGDGGIAIHKAQTTDWTEENLTINNAPTPEIQLASMNKAYKVGAPEKVTLDAASLKAETTSLILTHDTGNDLAFASKEHPANKGPKLIITYDAPKDSPLIEQQEEEDSTQEEDTTKEEGTNQDENQNNNTASTEGAYYVTTNGKATNDGLSEATAWSIKHAFKNAAAGDIVYIKAGNYGNKQMVVDNSGTAEKHIKFIGYTNTPGDVISNKGSTFKHGDEINENLLPLIKGISNTSGIGLEIPEDFIEIHNFQVSNYELGVISKGENVVLNNIITVDNGIQSNNSSQTGRGFHIYGDYTKLENCFSLNANAEGINIRGASNCTVLNTQVYSDNTKNMGGYYIAITGGGNNNVIEGCTIYRDSSGDDTMNPHQGHGYVMKDVATNNIFRNCRAYNTGIEVNFSGVKLNTFKNIEIFGDYLNHKKQYSSCITIKNGAQYNTFDNIIIKDTRYAITFVDFDDGFAAADGDRDENQGGNNNTFNNIKIDKANNILFFNSTEIGWSATSRNNVFSNSSFKNIRSVSFITSQTTSGTRFNNCHFENISNKLMIDSYGKNNVLPISFENCTFTNVDFPIPN